MGNTLVTVTAAGRQTRAYNNKHNRYTLEANATGPDSGYTGFKRGHIDAAVRAYISLVGLCHYHPRTSLTNYCSHVAESATGHPTRMVGMH